MSERTAPIPGFPGYFASDSGKILNGFREVAVSSNEKGYLRFNARRADGRWKLLKVHRAVMMAFNPSDAPGLQVRHLDGDKANNRLENTDVWNAPIRDVFIPIGESPDDYPAGQGEGAL
jgi:hypothetical protein